MQGLAVALNNDTSVNTSEITDIFEFEKAIALVYFSYFIHIRYVVLFT